MSLISQIPSPSPLFLTPKADTAIPCGKPLLHDALRQFALDPGVARIDYVGHEQVDGTRVELDTVVVTRGRNRYLVEFEKCLPRTLDQEGLYLLASRRLGAEPFLMRTEVIKREPMFSSARTVWDKHSRQVSIESRSAILLMIETNGPLALGDLNRGLWRGAEHDVFGLACELTLQIDLRIPLHEAMVTLGPGPARRDCGRASGCLRFDHLAPDPC